MLRIIPIFAIICLLTGCRSFDGLTASDRVTVVEDIPYVGGSINKKHYLDLYLPKGKINSPAVVFIHGGFWKNQDRRYYWPFTGLYRNVGFAMAKQGYPVAVISYRLSPEVKIEGELADAAAAIVWVAENLKTYGADGSRIVLMGHSSGGHLASMLSLDTNLLKNYHSRIKGCVALSPILDIKNMERTNNQEFNQTTTYALFERDDNSYMKYSPIRYFSSKDHVPYLLMIGGKDYDYLIEQARRVSESQKKDGNFKIRVIPGFDHSDMVLNINTKEDLVTPPVIEFLSGLEK
jgi:acetyl esterase/lipase